jgi:hypothetical protein
MQTVAKPTHPQLGSYQACQIGGEVFEIASWTDSACRLSASSCDILNGGTFSVAVIDMLYVYN